MDGTRFNLIVILGPTASGKTRLAARLAKEIGSEIISADSRQVYRGMDIGTGKDLKEYIIDGVAIPYHLVDVTDPDHEFNVFEYQQMFIRCFSEISSRGIVPVMVGGSGLYIESVVMGYRMIEVPENPTLRKELEKEDMQALSRRLIHIDPEVHNTTDLLDRKRLIRAIEIRKFTKMHEHESEDSFPVITPLIIGVRCERSTLRRKITIRLKDRLCSGMIEEVKKLNESGIAWDKLDFFGLEYRYIGLYLQGRISYNDMFKKLNTRIHQFAKKQETWFRRMEKRGIQIRWIDIEDYDSIKGMVECLIK